jgi:hypothetical protein
MKTNSRKIGLVLVAIITMVSCSKDDSIFEEGAQNQKEVSARLENSEAEASSIKKNYCGAKLCPGHLGESVCRSTNYAEESKSGDTRTFEWNTKKAEAK